MWYGKKKPMDWLIVFLLWLKKEDKDIDPYFEIRKGYDKDAEVVSTDNSYIEGVLEKIELGGYDYEGEWIDTFKVYLRDGGETLIWTTSWNSLSRNFINGVCKLENKNVHLLISVYTDKKSGYKKIYTTHNGQPIGWKFDYEEHIKPLIVPMTNAKGKVEKNDYSLVDEMFKKEVEAMVFTPLDDVKWDGVFEAPERSVEELVEPTVTTDVNKDESEDLSF